MVETLRSASMGPRANDDLDALLAEQIAYYRARAPEYFDGAIDVSPETETAVRRELLGAIASFGPLGGVLELACGPGTWTADLLAHANDRDGARRRRRRCSHSHARRVSPIRA